METNITQLINKLNKASEYVDAMIKSEYAHPEGDDQQVLTLIEECLIILEG